MTVLNAAANTIAGLVILALIHRANRAQAPPRRRAMLLLGWTVGCVYFAVGSVMLTSVLLGDTP